MSEGPVINIKAVVINNTDSSLILYPCKSNVNITFCCNLTEYKQTYFGISMLGFYDIDKIIIEPHEQIPINLSSPLFLGTAILNNANSFHYNYTNELIQALPTLKLHYDDKAVSLESSGIRKVILTKSFNYTLR